MKLVTDPKHWFGWILSSAVITGAIVLVMHLLQKHCVHTPFWVVGVVFFVVLMVEVIVDIAKHYLKLQ